MCQFSYRGNSYLLIKQSEQAWKNNVISLFSNSESQWVVSKHPSKAMAILYKNMYSVFLKLTVLLEDYFLV